MRGEFFIVGSKFRVQCLRPANLGAVRRFEDIEILQRAREICREVQLLKNNSGLKSDFNLYNQIDRSSGSCMDNIAEGFERGGNKEFHQFLSIAKGSIGETRSQLYRAFDRGYCGEEKFNELHEACLLLSGKLKALMKYLNKSKMTGNKFKDQVSAKSGS